MIEPTQPDQQSSGMGLLSTVGNFLSSPGGMGLLSAVGAGLAGAKRGGPLNALGYGLLGGVQGFAQAQEDQARNQDRKALTEWNQTQRDWMTEDRNRMEAERKQRQSFLDQSLTPRPLLQPSQASDALKDSNPYTDPNFLYDTAKANNLPGWQQVPTTVMPVNPLDAMRNKFSPEEASQLRSLTQPVKPNYLTVKPGEVMLDPTNMKPVFTAPKEAAPTELSRLMTEMEGLPQGSPQRALYEAALKKSTTHAPGTNVSINSGQRGLENEFKLRDTFKAEPIYKAHQEMDSAYRQIKQSLAQANPAGDLAGATKLMKLLDPNSVVRESELGMAMQASGLMDRLQNYGNMVVTGQKLTPTQRKEFQQLADALYGESVKQFNAKRGEYERLGGEYGLNAGRALGPNVQPVQALPKLQQQPVRRKYNPATGRIE